MFKLADENTTYDYPVTVPVPAQGGGVEKHEFTAKFRLVSNDEAQRMSDDGVDDKDFLKRVLAGWDGIADHDGEPLEYNDANLERLANIRYFNHAVGQAYAQFSMGLPAKNSKTPRAH